MLLGINYFLYYLGALSGPSVLSQTHFYLVHSTVFLLDNSIHYLGISSFMKGNQGHGILALCSCTEDRQTLEGTYLFFEPVYKHTEKHV